MAGLKAIKRRIVSVKNTRKITRAMKMVAAGRLRRAQQRITELRPYANKTAQLIAQVAARVEGDTEQVHPLLAHRPERKVLIVVLTSDRGLAGGFNANINKRAYALWKSLEAEGKQVSFGIVGKKGGDFFRRRRAEIAKVFTGVFENLTSAKAGEVGRFIADPYVAGELDAAWSCRRPPRATTSTSQTGRRCSIGCCRCTWRSSPTGRCSSRWPRSTARA
jgi:F-type H+-transporting ATPase subunit gamma